LELCHLKGGKLNKRKQRESKGSVLGP